MIGIVAGMAQNYSYAATQLCLAGFAGDDTARAVFPDKGLDVPVVCNVMCWPCLCSTVEVRSCSSAASWSDVYGGFWKNLLYFLRECVLRSLGRFSPWFAQGNLDIIPMSFLMTSEGRFSRILRHFSHAVRMDVSAHFSALDDGEFFVVEGSGWRGTPGVRLPGVLQSQFGACVGFHG